MARFYPFQKKRPRTLPLPLPESFSFIINEKAYFGNVFFMLPGNNISSRRRAPGGFSAALSIWKGEVERVKEHRLAKGIGLGMLAGAALGAAMMPRKASVKKATGKAVKSMGQVMENLSDELGF